jgi:restriction system protein
MAVPDFQTVMRPVLAALEDGQAWSQPQLRTVVADLLDVSDDDQLQMLPSGKQTTFGNRVAWALTHMAKAGLIDRPARGRYVLTDRGRAILATYPRRVDMTVLSQFPEYQAFRAIKHDKAERQGKIAPPDDVSPSEAVGTIIEDSYDALAEELLDRVLAQPPVFLETLSLRLLRAMGYGGREAILEHSGKPGDAGLDGVVRQDALGLDLVGVQAKRYDKGAPVNRPEVQGFRWCSAGGPDQPRGVCHDGSIQPWSETVRRGSADAARAHRRSRVDQTHGAIQRGRFCARELRTQAG